MKFIQLLMMCMCFFISNAMFSQHRIQGKVLSDENEPVISEAVQLLPDNILTYTDVDGKFIFENIATGEYVLVLPGCWTNNEKKIFVDESKENIILYYENTIHIDEVVINSVRFNQKNNPSQITMSKKDITEELGVTDMPYMIQNTPGVVVTSDAGAGVGYTGLRIRGTDQTRINVTINGIPLNDAESQNVFFVDLPDLAASAESIQIQRGVGTSSHGAASFGASVNVNTHQFSNDAGATFSGYYGSFNTKKASLTFNTGKIRNGFFLNGRISQITSDGYIDRATADLKSLALSPLFVFGNNSLRYDLLYGKERTYQAWYGISGEQLMIDRTFNPAGTERPSPPYPDQVDDYQQVHHQVHFNSKLSPKTTLGLSMHYTPGSGYFEEYKADQSRLEYGFAPAVIFRDTIDQTDLVRRRWLDNHFYGVVGSVEYDWATDNKLIIGGGWNHYIGDHFGQVIWAEVAQGIDVEQKYYKNKADKYDGNVYVKYLHQFNTAFSAYADVQYRSIVYQFAGPDQNGNITDREDKLHFFNPKIGMSCQLNPSTILFFQSGISQKEPNRDDYVDSSPLSRPKSEWLWDTEVGAQWSSKGLTVSPNLYFMKYRDQLALNGAINDVGATTRINVDDSHRIGLELEFDWQVAGRWNVKGNATWSNNSVSAIDQFVDRYDENFNYLGQQKFNLNNRPLAYSPDLVAFLRLGHKLVNSKNLELSLSADGKYVSRQYLDLSGDENNTLAPYSTLNASLNLKIKNIIAKSIHFRFHVNNILDAAYAANAWSYKYMLNENITYDQGFYPQALRHYGVSFAIEL